VTTVATVLLAAPTMNACAGDNLLAFGYRISLNRSNKPYVMAGLTHNTREGFSPLHRPVTPSSPMISLAVAIKPFLAF